jgi:hypothetical protein
MRGTVTMVLATFQLDSDHPTLSDAARVLGVKAVDLDAEFGVATINRGHGTYAVRVNADALNTSSRHSSRVSISSDPAIRALG